MFTVVRAIRGATTVERDDADHITERVQELMATLFDRNRLRNEEVISIFFTATADISAVYPAAAARGLGLDDVPLLGAQELTVEGMLPRCVRVLLHVSTTKSRDNLHHVYLHDARSLRPDLIA